MFLFKSQKIRAIEITLKILADFHAVSLDNEKFISQYRSIFQILSLYKLNEKVKK